MEWTERATDSLPARLFLLGCDVGAERVKWGDELGYAVRAGVLAELAARGCLREEGRKARPVGDRRTGDPVLDGVLREIADLPRPKRWSALVRRERRQTCLALEGQLAKSGVISVESRTLRRKRITVHERDLPGRLRAEAVATLTGEETVGQVEPLRAALASMAALAHLCPELNWRVRYANRRRLKELTERAGPAGHGLKKALDARRAANNGGGGG